MSALEKPRLAQVEAQLEDHQVKLEAAVRTVFDRAIRIGELLNEAKALVPHGAWLPWLSEHFRGSERTAQAWMQLAREPKSATVADLGVRGALEALAAPRDGSGPEDPGEEAEEVDGEVVDAEPTRHGPSIMDRLQALGPDKLKGAMAELDAEREHRRRNTFPRNGVERATFRQIRAAMDEAERAFHGLRRPDISDWTRAEALAAAGYALTRGGSLALDLADAERRWFSDPTR